MDPGKGSTPSTACSSRPPGPDFPAGLRVLVVDDDPICLAVIEKLLRQCLYDVTTCTRSAEALSMLRERRGWFDLVLSDVYMPDMDGFKLLEQIGLEMDLPVIMISGDDNLDLVMKGVTHGACDYLVKPVRIEPLKNIWQHVVRKKRNEYRELENSAGSMEENDRQRRASEEGDHAPSLNEGNTTKRKKVKEEEEEDVEEREDSPQRKKPRVVWSIDLHQQFVAAVNQLGVDKAVPKKILELMNNSQLTRENVASHLQKYRLYLKRVGDSQNQGRVDVPFTNAQDRSFRSISSVDRFELQALAASGQFSQQTLAALHPAQRRSAETAMGMSAVDQIGLLNSGVHAANTYNMRSALVQSINNRRMNYLSGSSNGMDLRKFGQSQQMVQPYGAMNIQFSQGASGFLSSPSSQSNSSFPGIAFNGQLNKSLVMQMSQQGQQFSLPQQQSNANMNLPEQPHSRVQLMNGVNIHDNRIPLTTGQQVSSKDIPSHVSGRLGANTNALTSLVANYMTNSSFNTVPQAVYTDVHNNSMTGSAVSSYTLASNIGDTTATENVEAFSTTNLKGVNDYDSSYDIFSELPQNQSLDWNLQNVNISYQEEQHIGSSLVAHQDSIATIKDGGNTNTCTITKERFSVITEIEREKIKCVAQGNHAILAENSIRMKSDGMPDISYQDGFFENHEITNISNELINVVKQKEDIEQADPEFYFDNFTLDNISV